MKSSLARSVAFLTMAVVVAVGCRSLYNSADGGRGAGAAGLSDSDSSTDPFGASAGFFPNDSHDVPGGTLPVVAEEEEQATDGEETASHFRAIQIDPVFETSSGPKFVMPFDIDNDGMVDLLTGWNQSQPVQIHLQRRDGDGNVHFVTVNLGGTGPIALIGDVDMADFDGDGWLDVALLVKETGSIGVCPKEGGFEPIGGAGMGEVQILFNPGDVDQITDGDAWEEVRLERSKLPGRRGAAIATARTFPEFNGYTGLGVGEIDGINGPDIVVAYNPATCEFYGDLPDPINRIVLYVNPGGANMRDPGGIPLSVTAVASGPEQVNTNGDVTLNGSGSFSRVGVSGLGPAFGEVDYLWTQEAGPVVSLSGITSAKPTFTTPGTAAALTFRLSVSAGGATDFDYVTVVVTAPGAVPANLPPTVQANGELTVVPDADQSGAITVQMSASGYDPDGDTLTYTWTQVRGEAVVLSGGDTATPSFAAPAAGDELRFRVTVSDGTLLASDLVVVNCGFWAPVRIDEHLATAGDVKLKDVDLDGDNDILYTYPDAITRNISWARNPVDVVGSRDTLVPANWEVRPVGHVDTDADVFTLGDVDNDGFDDLLVRSSTGHVVQWFRHPGTPPACTGDEDCGMHEVCVAGQCVVEPIFPPPDVVPDRFNFPWQVFTVAEYPIGRLAGIALGDLTGDGSNEIAVAAGGIVYWYEADLVESSYDQWLENFVIDDTKVHGTTDDVEDIDFQDDGTVIYSLTVVDIDGDGARDIIATFDRRVESGLADDSLIWFRNTIRDEASGE